MTRSGRSGAGALSGTVAGAGADRAINHEQFLLPDAEPCYGRDAVWWIGCWSALEGTLDPVLSHLEADLAGAGAGCDVTELDCDGGDVVLLNGVLVPIDTMSIP